jgi:Tfp pilus assembly protein PilF
MARVTVVGMLVALLLGALWPRDGEEDTNDDTQETSANSYEIARTEWPAGLGKEARALLEQSLEQDLNALDGSANTSLGSLYYKVPGGPIGFGSDKRAREQLEAALRINPEGIDPNYFMGEFLYESGDYEAARTHLETALAAPDRPGRDLVDTGQHMLY